MIAFFYLLNRFESLFIILFSYNNFQYGSIIDFIEAEIKVNPKFI